MLKKIAKYFLIFCVICGVASALTGGGNSPTNNPAPTKQEPAPAPAPKQYALVDANTMMGDLERNAAAAQQKYKGQAVCVEGRVGVIDSNGDYILIQSDNEFAITGIICDVNKRDDQQKNFLMSIQKGQRVRAYGEITDVGEVLGYRLKTDVFEAK